MLQGLNKTWGRLTEANCNCPDEPAKTWELGPLPPGRSNMETWYLVLYVRLDVQMIQLFARPAFSAVGPSHWGGKKVPLVLQYRLILLISHQ
jgi:hypothetical protein